MKKTLNSVLGVVLSSILFLLLGAVLLIWPDIAGKAVCYALGVMILIFAITRIVSFFTDRQVYFIFNLNLVVGLVAAAVSIFMLLRPEMVLAALPFIIGLFLVVSSVLDFQKVFILNQYGNPHWKSSLVFAILKTLFGAVMLVIPLFFTETFIQLIGIALIYNGLSELWIIFRWPKDGTPGKT